MPSNYRTRLDLTLREMAELEAYIPQEVYDLAYRWYDWIIETFKEQSLKMDLQVRFAISIKGMMQEWVHNTVTLSFTSRWDSTYHNNVEHSEWLVITGLRGGYSIQLPIGSKDRKKATEVPELMNRFEGWREVGTITPEKS